MSEWFVLRSDNEVELLTLDELDEAFQHGLIDANTMVLAHGATEWARLGDLAGLDEPDEPLAPASVSAPGSLRPVSMELSDIGDDDVSFQSFRPSKSRKWIFGVVAVAGVLGVAAFTAQHSGMISANRTMAAVKPASGRAVATIPARPTPPPAPPPTIDPSTTLPMATPSSGDSPGNRPTQDQGDTRTAADKLRGVEAKTHQKARAAPAALHVARSESKAQGFTTGGNKFDPLNATIP